MNEKEIINTKANIIREELTKWKNDLINVLLSNIFKKEDLFLITNYWFENYEKYLSDTNNVNYDFDEKFGTINNDSLIFSSYKISIEELPKVFVLNKNNWNLIQEENSQVISIMSIGTFLDNLLFLKISEKIHCFFFVDNKKQLRQGYLEITNMTMENLILNDILSNGILDIIKRNQEELNDNKLFINNKDYNIIIKPVIDNTELTKDIFNYFKKIKESIKVKINFDKALTFRKSLNNCHENLKKTIFKKMENFKNIKKVMEKVMIENSNKNPSTKTNNELNINKNKEVHNINLKSLASDEKEKKLKTNKKRNGNSVQNRDIKLKKRMSKIIDVDLDISEFCPVKAVEKQSSPGIIGLVNIGATCYMNATLQCFSNITRLRKELLNKDVYKDLENNKDKNKKLSFALAEVLKNLWENLNQRFYPPENFKKVISEMNPLFKGIAANDPKDLILFLLETIHKELNTPPNKEIKNNYFINNNNLIEVFQNFFSEYNNKNKSIISDEFYGYTNSMTSCEFCNNTIHNVQTINMLFFPLEEVRKFKRYNSKNIRINDCFEYYERIDIYPSFYCNNCKNMFEAYNLSKIIYAPKTLIINLNRGRGLQYDVNIIFEEYLNLRNFIYANDSPFYYELTGVICHFGTNDSGGHFIAFCKNCYNCQWYKYNDQMVTKCSFNEVLRSGLPYVLFYSYIKA